MVKTLAYVASLLVTEVQYNVNCLLFPESVYILWIMVLFRKTKGKAKLTEACRLLLLLSYNRSKTLFFSTGNGAGFLKIMERLMRGVWTPTAVEVMQPTL